MRQAFAAFTNILSLAATRPLTYSASKKRNTRPGAPWKWPAALSFFRKYVSGAPSIYSKHPVAARMFRDEIQTLPQIGVYAN